MIFSSPGIFTSGQLIQNFAEEFKSDVYQVKLSWNQTLNSGTVRYFVSNDGVNYPVEITVMDAIYRLPSSNDKLDTFQSKYNDLRVRIVITGDALVYSLKIDYSLI